MTTDFFNGCPEDWEYPNWGNISRVHNWRNYADDHVIGIWDSLTNEQKKILANNFQRIADEEEWD